jgi:hypothetical protein
LQRSPAPPRFTLAPEGRCGKPTTEASPRNPYRVVAIFQKPHRPAVERRNRHALLAGKIARICNLPENTTFDFNGRESSARYPFAGRAALRFT